MSQTSNLAITVQLTGDITYTQQFTNAANTSSPSEVELQNLASGANTITPPTSTTKFCLMIPPSGNTETITLKGVTGDTGVVLHKTNPSVIGLNNGATTFCLTASGAITGVRMIWG